MFKRIIVAMLMGCSAWVAQAADALQPFILAYTADGEVAAEADRVRAALQAQQFQVLGEYSPFADAHVIAVSNSALQQAARGSTDGGFGAAVHVAITRVGNTLQVAYMNPPYMAAAYRMNELPDSVAESLAEALGAKQAYGTRDGRMADDLRQFHYMVGMEYFTDPYELASYDDQAEALAAVDANLARQVGGSALVYKLAVPGTEQVIYGISRAKVEDKRANDGHILKDTVDAAFDLKTTPYLPYQLLVSGGEVKALHMRFRMAVYHPDLTMGTFGKLMSSPGAIEELLRKVAGGKEKRRFSF